MLYQIQKVTGSQLLSFTPYNEIKESRVKALIPCVIEALENPGSMPLVTEDGTLLQACHRQSAFREHVKQFPEDLKRTFSVAVVPNEVKDTNIAWKLNQTSTPNFLHHILKTKYGKDVVSDVYDMLVGVYGKWLKKDLIGQLSTRASAAISLDQEVIDRINAGLSINVGGNALFNLKNNDLCNRHFDLIVEDVEYIPLTPVTLKALRSRLDPLKTLIDYLYSRGLWQAVFRRSTTAHYTLLAAALNGSIVKANPRKDQVTIGTIIRRINANKTKLAKLAHVESGKKSREARLATDTLWGAATDFNNAPKSSENTLKELMGLPDADEKSSTN